ncbi:Histidine kinase-, DNA gyrase B-, and HSP90-like ATPase [Algoriphagus alkaliphilus]|uniref:histidine kinase n=1 Tax=Algoriphagus alkaliphilus TaxID=279824 RepID=A0A1G5XQ51_9BACT|nr:ATP-binding protein [Algoriphagus alkaliphilus]MBA4301894.1 histidine kinase [Cyclobacterium sp.]SDA72563.1 Histidine kinase-, DNA gyrase B-, and HSP90-like ATPase [Algoriphagus alkaliphilus]
MKNRFQDLTSIDFYKNKKQVRWLVFFISVLIGSGSIWYTSLLVEELRERENRQIQLLSSAMEYAATTSENLTFINQEIIQQNYSIPIIMVDSQGDPIEFRNISFKKNSDGRDSIKTLERELLIMQTVYEPIYLQEADIRVFYRNSELLTSLKFYPYVQLAVILVFGILAFALFNQSKISEQNRVWAGLTKETAHQLGTPIASLMAWIDYLRNSPVWEENREIIQEMDKDVVKLRMVTERFSSIGSKPVIQPENLYQVIEETITYLRPRISTKVDMNIHADSKDLEAMMNKPLFEWVIENICKNGVDAMKGKGILTIDVLQDSDKYVIVDISDTGKGIEKKNFRKVFNPGFSTRQRGWGLGLTLAKRIVEGYHGGKIFVKSSEIGKGTTFRIMLLGNMEDVSQFVTEGILEY